MVYIPISYCGFFFSIFLKKKCNIIDDYVTNFSEYLIFPECICWIAECILVTAKISLILLVVYFGDSQIAIPPILLPFIVFWLINHKLICFNMCILGEWLGNHCFTNAFFTTSNVNVVAHFDFRNVFVRRTTPGLEHILSRFRCSRSQHSLFRIVSFWVPGELPGSISCHVEYWYIIFKKKLFNFFSTKTFRITDSKNKIYVVFFCFLFFIFCLFFIFFCFFMQNRILHDRIYSLLCQIVFFLDLRFV